MAFPSTTDPIDSYKEQLYPNKIDFVEGFDPATALSVQTNFKHNLLLNVYDPKTKTGDKRIIQNGTITTIYLPATITGAISENIFKISGEDTNLNVVYYATFEEFQAPAANEIVYVQTDDRLKFVAFINSKWISATPYTLEMNYMGTESSMSANDWNIMHDFIFSGKFTQVWEEIILVDKKIGNVDEDNPIGDRLDRLETKSNNITLDTILSTEGDERTGTTYLQGDLEVKNKILVPFLETTEDVVFNEADGVIQNFESNIKSTFNKTVDINDILTTTANVNLGVDADTLNMNEQFLIKTTSLTTNNETIAKKTSTITTLTETITDKISTISNTLINKFNIVTNLFNGLFSETYKDEVHREYNAPVIEEYLDNIDIEYQGSSSLTATNHIETITKQTSAIGDYYLMLGLTEIDVNDLTTVNINGDTTITNSADLVLNTTDKFTINNTGEFNINGIVNHNKRVLNNNGTDNLTIGGKATWDIKELFLKSLVTITSDSTWNYKNTPVFSNGASYNGIFNHAATITNYSGASSITMSGTSLLTSSGTVDLLGDTTITNLDATNVNLETVDINNASITTADITTETVGSSTINALLVNNTSTLNGATKILNLEVANNAVFKDGIVATDNIHSDNSISAPIATISVSASVPDLTVANSITTKNLTANGTTTLNGNTSIGNGAEDIIELHGQAYLHGNMGIEGILNVGTTVSDLGTETLVNEGTLKNKSNLINDGSITNSGRFDNTGDANISGNIDVSGTGTLGGELKVGGLLDVDGDLIVGGTITINNLKSNTFTVFDNTTLNNLFTVDDRVIISELPHRFNSIAAFTSVASFTNGINTNTLAAAVSLTTPSATITNLAGTTASFTGAVSTGDLTPSKITTNDASITTLTGTNVTLSGKIASPTGDISTLTAGLSSASNIDENVQVGSLGVISKAFENTVTTLKLTTIEAIATPSVGRNATSNTFGDNIIAPFVEFTVGIGTVILYYVNGTLHYNVLEVEPGSEFRIRGYKYESK